MFRLFVGLALPIAIRQHLLTLCAGIPGARWQTSEQFHITLRFIGEVDGAVARDIVMALEAVHVPAFDVTLRGIGEFGDRKRANTVWAGVDAPEAMMRLQQKIEHAMQQVGLPPERRRYIPHVTLARLGNTPRGRVGEYIGAHGGFRSLSFRVDEFVLFSSFLSHSGAIYTPEEAFPLSGTAFRPPAWMDEAAEAEHAHEAGE